MEEAIKKYGDIPICIIYHEAWNTFDETISIYVSLNNNIEYK